MVPVVENCLEDGGKVGGEHGRVGAIRHMWEGATVVVSRRWLGGRELGGLLSREAL